MTRPRYPSSDGALPPPLPPETRTVGQLVAETLHLYGRRFWSVLPLGLGLALLGLGPFGLSAFAWLGVLAVAGSLLCAATATAAAVLVAEARPPARALLVAVAAGVVAFVPVWFLVRLFVLPAVAWLALVGLAVPVAVIERTSLTTSLRRAVQLARADFVHAIGSLAALVVLYFLTRVMLILLLRGTGDQTERIAVFLADIVLGPVLFLGAALLYYDQAARVGRGRRPAVVGSGSPSD